MILAFASANGVREIYTWTQTGNAAMRALNDASDIDPERRASQSAGRSHCPVRDDSELTPADVSR